MPTLSIERGRDASSPRAIAAILVLAFALATWLGFMQNRPPAPAGTDAPASEFSAARAMAVLERILGDQRPHPTGSAANAAVRDAIVAELRAIGLEPEVQRRFACGGFTCATVDNIVARVPGASPDDAALLSAHYDSVAAGPGASDDGAGVAAVIEAARALLAGPAPARDVWLLLNDGEELGLVGAEAFVREPAFAHIARVVNLEARGTTGASLLIETHAGNAALSKLLRRSLAAPAGSSLEYEIYRTLPNDTDFTVYKRDGLAGANFAWARAPARYHTPLDDIAHLDPGSLQHHGEHALSLARAFAAAEPPVESADDAVFFSLPGGVMAGWPVAWNPLLLALAVLGWLALGWRLVRVRAARAMALPVAGGLVLGGVAALLVAGLLGHLLLRALGAMPATWTAQGGAMVGAMLLLAVGLLVPLGWLVRRLCGEAALGWAALLPSALIAVGAVLWMPGGAHIGLLPLLVGVVAGHVAPRRAVLWAGLAALPAALLWMPYAEGAYDAVGHEGLVPVPAVVGYMLLPLLPAVLSLPRGTTIATAAGWLGAAACTLLALARPAFDADTPRPANLLLVAGPDGSQLFAQSRAQLPEAFLRDAGFGREREPMNPWGTRGLPGPAGPALAAPIVVIEQREVVGERQRLQVRLRSARGATTGGLMLPGTVDLGSVRVDGQPLATSRWHAGSEPWRGISVVGLEADGAVFVFELPLDAGPLHAFDRSHGLPAALDAATAARDAIGVPIGGGDAAIAWTTIELPQAASTGAGDQSASNRSISAK
ncbi:M20/M25/M40 family metallo-hydrolase [Novilysobacter arseniciresistens]|uniref:M20/M25/M40 family metallo-hydrolase n=1 Tax=Novilysobacter arseniciresistens TaxID=1385522 RepID=UPI00069205C1|nr:M20/M25/M40 family metallo-hydrolase [Lysobacter arseniciresistens]